MKFASLVNLVAFHIGWLACALGAARGLPWLGVVVVPTLLAAQLPLVASAKRQLRLIGIAAAAGWLVDSLLMGAGVFTFPGHDPRWGCPLWMAALWANFAGTLHLAMSWLRGRYAVATLFGALGGPLSYYAGDRIGAIDLATNLPISLAMIGVEWAVAMPALVWTSMCGPCDAIHASDDDR